MMTTIIFLPVDLRAVNGNLLWSGSNFDKHHRVLSFFSDADTGADADVDVVWILC